MNALGPSLAPYVRSSRSLKKLVTPVAHWYADLMGYRRMGLKYDDLRACCIFVPSSRLTLFLEMEELPEVQRVRRARIGRLLDRERVTQALGRLTPREAYDRAYRMKVSLHASVVHKDLPKDKWVSVKDVCVALSALVLSLILV